MANLDSKKVDAAVERINRNGGKASKVTKSFQLPAQPGLKLLAAADCLKNHAGWFGVVGG